MNTPIEIASVKELLQLTPAAALIEAHRIVREATNDCANDNADDANLTISYLISLTDPKSVDDVRTIVALVEHCVPTQSVEWNGEMRDARYYEGYFTVVCSDAEIFAFHALTTWIGEGMDEEQAAPLIARYEELFDQFDEQESSVTLH